MRAQPQRNWTPTDLYSGGRGTGIFLDFTDPTTLFANATLTTPATIGGTLQGVQDKSSTSRPCTTTSSTITRQVNYASFPGTALGFSSASAQVGSTAGWTSICTVRPTTTGNSQWIDSDFNSGATRIGQDCITGGGTSVGFSISSGAVIHTAAGGAGTGAVNADIVITTIATPTLTVCRVNRVQVGSAAYASVVLNQSSIGVISFGSGWEGTTLNNQRQCTGRMYAGLKINRVLSGQELIDAENWFGRIIGI